MQFSNPDIDISMLPKAEESKLVPVDERYYTVLSYKQVAYWTIFFLITLIVMMLNSEFHSWMMVGITLAVFAILCFLNFRLTYLDFKSKAYAVREHDILYQTGWLKKSLHVCPYNRIQHCSVDAGVFERNLGISKLRIFSAGGSDSDIVIPGLRPEEANNLRELIILKNQQE
ncbi:MAG: PH domain-containing protein [Daejeonella sp.]|uniref:PH domain-containing protein n=1 Tax=Daejeonella sp. TaxID=2805397 RepID=UPI003C78D21B